MADRCIPHSNNIRDFLLQQGLSERTGPVVNFGIHIDEPLVADQELRERYGLGQYPVVLYAGVMDQFQRLDLLLEAEESRFAVPPGQGSCIAGNCTGLFGRTGRVIYPVLVTAYTALPFAGLYHRSAPH